MGKWMAWIDRLIKGALESILLRQRTPKLAAVLLYRKRNRRKRISSTADTDQEVEE